MAHYLNYALASLSMFSGVLVMIFGILWFINVIDKQLEKALKAITNKYELWGIMHEATRIYRAKKKDAKEGR